MSSTAISDSAVTPASCKPNNAARDKDTDSRLSLSMGNLKDIRAYEHDRQKAKKEAELVKRKARNSPRWPRPLYGSKIHSSSPPALSGKHERLKVEDLDSLEGVEYDADVRRVPHSLPSRGVIHKTEVKLTDLITPRKPRKGNDGDFEVIPHVRSVIVIDDFVGLDPSVEEPWECIYGQCEEDGVRTRSYADILSTK